LANRDCAQEKRQEGVLTDLLVCIRAVHFAATIGVAGAVFFAVFISEPAFQKAGKSGAVSVIARRTLAFIAWIGLVLTLLSGALWLVLLAQSFSDQTLREIFTEGTVGLVLSSTGFGNDWLARLVLAFVLGCLFVPLFSEPGHKSFSVKLAAVVLSAALVGTLAWAGHAAGGAGAEALVHPIADIIHLIAAAAWVGTLLPLAILLAACGGDTTSIAAARAATVRFSAFGIGSVATLLVTGSINTWYLAGSYAALTETDYGHLLLIKIALFVVMVAVAAFNRLALVPRLVQDASVAAAQDALRQLRRNAAIEVAIGAAVIAIVAVLGTNPPGLEALAHGGHHH
jgi:copper resistance protein D